MYYALIDVVFKEKKSFNIKNPKQVDEPYLDNNREKRWTITVFGPHIAEECFKFYTHMVGRTFRIEEPESFSLHMPTPFLKMPVLHKAFKKVRRTFSQVHLNMFVIRFSLKHCHI